MPVDDGGWERIATFSIRLAKDAVEYCAVLHRYFGAWMKKYPEFQTSEDDLQWASRVLAASRDLQIAR
jgi:hypothetical protein